MLHGCHLPHGLPVRCLFWDVQEDSVFLFSLLNQVVMSCLGVELRFRKIAWGQFCLPTSRLVPAGTTHRPYSTLFCSQPANWYKEITDDSSVTNIPTEITQSSPFHLKWICCFWICSRVVFVWENYNDLETILLKERDGRLCICTGERENSSNIKVQI